MLTQLLDSIRQDSKAGEKLGILGAGFGLISLAITYLYPAGYWLSGFINVFMFVAWGCMGIVWVVRQEIPPFIPIRGVPAKVLGLGVAIICFALAIGMLAITLLYLLGGSI